MLKGMSSAAIQNPDPTTQRPARPRRRYPLSVRIFGAILVLLGAASVLWVGIPAYRQHVAVRTIEHYGGAVSASHRVGPAWLRHFVGEERMMAFDEIDAITFHSDSATVHRRIGKIRFKFVSIATIGREGPSIDDSTLACISGTPRLKWLSLSFCDIGDGGMEHLARAVTLEHLDLRCTDVSDACLTRLETLRNLRSVDLEATNVTDAGIAQLQIAMPELQIHK